MFHKTWIIVLLIVSTAWGQADIAESVYFKFDKYDILKSESEKLLGFLATIDSSLVDSIEIFGYCDDIGKDDYNKVLSENRAEAVKTLMLEQGIKSKIIVTIEGKGRVIIEDDLIENLPEVRSKNRRVDVVVNLQNPPKKDLDIPGVYTEITGKLIVGDRIYLENLLFERGSSKLTHIAKKELDRIAKLLLKYKNIHFEIQGHVCCTPLSHKEAIDRDTKKRELSKNRALEVYKYLLLKKIPQNRMTYKGYGNTEPLGKDPRLDRRVELLITKV